MKKTTLSALAAAAILVGLGAGTASAVGPKAFPDGTVAFVPNGDEWWTCVAGSLAAPYVSIQVPQQGPAPQYARFTPGIDVAVACAGTEKSTSKIVRPGN